MAALHAVEPPKPIDSDPTKEYIGGGNIFSLFGGALTPATDDLGLVLGLETYRQMSLDPDVWAALLLLKILVLADGVQIQPCVAQPEPGKYAGAQRDYAEAQKRYERAKLIADFCTRSIAGMKPGIISLFEEKLDALTYGNKISEVTLKDGAGVDRGKLVFDSIKAKPYTAVQFVVDRFWNLTGFLPAWSADGKGERKVLPPEKFFYLSLHSTNNDPRGNSSLRPMYDAWSFKQKTWPIYFKWLALCAIYKLIAKVKNGGALEQVTDAEGQPINENGRPKTISRARAVFNALLQLENGTAVTIGPDDDVKPLNAEGTGEQFERAFTIVKKQLTKTLLLQELATLDATHQTKGSTVDQSQYVDVMVWYLKNKLIDAFRAQPLTLLVQVNFGEDAAREFLPMVSMGDSSRKDWAKDGKALRLLGDCLTDSQWLQGTDQLGFKRPDEGEVLPPRGKAASTTSSDDGSIEE